MTKQFKIFYKATIILLAVIATLLLGSIILVTINADVLKTYLVIFTEPLKNKIQLTEVLIRAIPLSIIALGITVAYRSGIINIGAEGQMAIGILTATATALAIDNVPRPLNIIFIIIAGAVGGGLWGFIPGILKAKLKVSELLSTVMLNYICCSILHFFSKRSMIDPAELTMEVVLSINEISKICLVNKINERYKITFRYFFSYCIGNIYLYSTLENLLWI